MIAMEPLGTSATVANKAPQWSTAHPLVRGRQAGQLIVRSYARQPNILRVLRLSVKGTWACYEWDWRSQPVQQLRTEGGLISIHMKISLHSTYNDCKWLTTYKTCACATVHCRYRFQLNNHHLAVRQHKQHVTSNVHPSRLMPNDTLQYLLQKAQTHQHRVQVHPCLLYLVWLCLETKTETCSWGRLLLSCVRNDKKRQTASLFWAAWNPPLPTWSLWTQNHPLPYLHDTITTNECCMQDCSKYLMNQSLKLHLHTIPTSTNPYTTTSSPMQDCCEWMQCSALKPLCTVDSIQMSQTRLVDLYQTENQSTYQLQCIKHTGYPLIGPCTSRLIEMIPADAKFTQHVHPPDLCSSVTFFATLTPDCAQCRGFKVLLSVKAVGRCHKLLVPLVISSALRGPKLFRPSNMAWGKACLLAKLLPAMTLNTFPAVTSTCLFLHQWTRLCLHRWTFPQVNIALSVLVLCLLQWEYPR